MAAKVPAAGVDLDGAVTVNESSADVDFRIETNGNANMFLVDGGNDAVIFNGSTSNFASSSQVVQVYNSGLAFTSGYGIQGGVNADRASVTLTSGASGHIVFKANNSEVARFTTDGLAIGGTGAANTLDDYEEGTWTATLSGTGSSSGQGYDNQTMQYTKIGRIVYLTGMLDMNSLGTLGGDYLKITGLPFTPDSSNSNSYQPITTHHVNVAGDVTGAEFGWTVYAANTFMYVFERTHGGAAQATASGDYENGTIVGCSGAYITAS